MCQTSCVSSTHLFGRNTRPTDNEIYGPIAVSCRLAAPLGGWAAENNKRPKVQLNRPINRNIICEHWACCSVIFCGRRSRPIRGAAPKFESNLWRLAPIVLRSTHRTGPTRKFRVSVKQQLCRSCVTRD